MNRPFHIWGAFKNYALLLFARYLSSFVGTLVTRLTNRNTTPDFLAKRKKFDIIRIQISSVCRTMGSGGAMC